MNDGEINIRRTHPNLYWLLILLSFTSIALGLNFIIFKPTFDVWDAPNVLWGMIFLVSGFARIITLTVYRQLRWVRATMFFSVVYMAFLSIGHVANFFDGQGSLQLPIMYAGMALLQLPLLWEPFVNPVTAK